MVLLLIVVLLCFKSVKENLRIKNNKLFPDEMKNLLFSLIFLQNLDKTVGKIDCIFYLERWRHGIMVICTEPCKDDGGEETSLFNVLWCRVHILIPLYGYAAAYAPMHINRDISSDQTPLDKKKKGGKRTEPPPPEVILIMKMDIRIQLYLWVVLRMVRKLTMSRLWASSVVLMFSYGNKRVGVSRKNGPKSNVCWKKHLPLLYFFMSYHTNNSMKKNITSWWQGEGNINTYIWRCDGECG